MTIFFGLDTQLLSSISFILCLLAGGPFCDVDDKENYTEIENEENNTSESSPLPYSIYWNVPSFQCHKYGLNFSRISTVWGINQNWNDDFRGDAVAILYDPGEFPALLDAPPAGTVPRNGGVPQEGSLDNHLRHFKNHLEKLIPWRNFKGLAILDFEHWRPKWHQNWGSLNIYRQYSRSVERIKHPYWFPSKIEKVATRRYESMAKLFVLETLKLAKRLRPLATWGYYGYPFCFNYTPYNNKESCSDEVVKDNDNMSWLFDEMPGHFPSLYLRELTMNSAIRKSFVKGRLIESSRVAKSVGAKLYPYVWYKYHDTHNFLSTEDMEQVLSSPMKYKSSGVVIWGASKDVNTEGKCLALANYVERVIGPAVQKLNRKKRRRG